MSLSIKDAQVFQKRTESCQGKETSDTGYMRRTPWPFSFLPERFGALPLFPQYWRFLPYLQNAEYICGWLYLLRQSQNGLYIPWIAAASFSMWRERPVRITCHRHGSGRNWQKRRGNRSSVNGILMPQGRKKPAVQIVYLYRRLFFSALLYLSQSVPQTEDCIFHFNRPLRLNNSINPLTDSKKMSN